MKTLIFLLAALNGAQAQTLGTQPRDRRETQTITCGLQFPNATALEAVQSIEVKNSEARLTGESRNYKFTFSVAGKTGLGKITDLETGSSATAKGAIEMLSHGGRSGLQNMTVLRRGDDDDRDGENEKEGSFDLAINGRQGNLVTLKCESHKQKQMIPAFLSNPSENTTVRTMALPISAALAGCSEKDYIEVPATTVTYTVATKGSTYSPRCLKIHKSTKLIIEATASHPLQGIESAPGTTLNPIYDELGATSNTKNVEFPTAGIFGYYCVAHGNDRGEGMAGSIWVID
jgi:plastocyanin